MNQYIEPVKTAILFFPFVALLFTVPYMLVQYRKFGAILLLRTAVIYSFILYLMCAYFLTILPLPDVEKVGQLTTPTLQLIPFREFGDIIRSSGVDWSDPSTYGRLVMRRDVFQIFANIAMTVPFGVYLRYYFGCSLRKTILLSFLLSLVFELTQLSALFGLYPRPYRLADVDDLMTNTLGGVIGYAISPLFMKILPSKARMDTVAYMRGTQVSVTRCAFAAMLDGVILFSSACLLLWLFPALRPDINGGRDLLFSFPLYYSAGITLYFIVGHWLGRGRTPGKVFLHLRLVDNRNGGRPKLWQCAVRYAVLYLIVLPTPLMIFLLMMVEGLAGGRLVAMIVVCIALILVYILFWLLLAVHVFTHSIQLLHGKLSMTRNISTLKVRRSHKRAVGASGPQKARGV